LPSELPVQWNNGIAISVVTVLFAGTAALLGILIAGIAKISLMHNPTSKK
jgi:hypothetical protein